jgi:hypothetical protein
VSSEPAIKQDLAEPVRQLDDNGAQEIAKMVDKVTKAIRDSQAEVRRAFSEMARSVEMRLGGLDELAQRMGRLDEQIADLEREKLPSTH